MKTILPIAAIWAAASLAHSAVIDFDLSPAGVSPGVGLSPSNVVPPVPSRASGNEVGSGIWFDSDTRTLSFALAFGSLVGFSDLSSPPANFGIHGPATVAENAPVVFNLAPFYMPIGPPTQAGMVVGMLTLETSQADELLRGRYYVSIGTLFYPAGELRGQLIGRLNTAPTITCPEPVTVACQSAQGTLVPVTVTVADADADALEVVWTVDGIPCETNQVGAGTSTPTNVMFQAMFGLGSHQVEVSVRDATHPPVTCGTSVTVVDNTPPDIRCILPSPGVLWPANHRMVPVTLEVQAIDECGSVQSRIVSVASNEPEEHSEPNWQITGPLTLELRAERLGSGDGRIYTITVEASDCSGNTSTGLTYVLVPQGLGQY